MQKKPITQEGLKLLACLTMLLDHIGAVLVDADWLRIVGRMAFPIYCFLLAEGIWHTKNPKRYGLRLLMGAILAELPFDHAIFGGFTWLYCSVMVTLLLGFLFGQAARKLPKLWQKILLLIPFAGAAELLNSDYGGYGVAMIALFLLTQDCPRRQPLQLAGLAALCLAMDSYEVPVLGFSVPIELFAVLAMIPISLYSGRKVLASRGVQWGFYLFYPLHLAVLALLRHL